ncbi:MAG: hypothetical protein Q9171_001380 [Xanthocarpia ochracea]
MAHHCEALRNPNAWNFALSLLLLFLLFFPRASPLSPPQPSKSAAPSYRTALFVVGVCITHIFLTAIVHLIFIYRYPLLLKPCAEFFGIAGTILAAVQFLPQIYTTWRLQTVGSLSIPMMCIQTPGSFVWVGSLAGRLGVAGWSTWGIYLVTGMLQGILLAMAIRFEVRDRRDRKNNNADGNVKTNGSASNEAPEERHDDERTTLLGREG